jgi:hypothetical protein
MFISVRQLEEEMGVDKRIGRFFVDRKVPESNSFWKDRLLYISFGNGFLSIPVYYDILYRIGVPIEKLLDEKHIEFMEQVMHFAILHERNEISYNEELESIRTLLNGRVQDMEYYNKLNNYLDQPKQFPLGPFGLNSPSLNRADVFLYILCDLPLSKIHWEKATRYWYSLHPTYLIMDDICDYEKDCENNENNIVSDLGGGVDAFEKTFELFRKNCETLGKLNPLLGEFLLRYEEGLREKIPANG